MPEFSVVIHRFRALPWRPLIVNRLGACGGKCPPQVPFPPPWVQPPILTRSLKASNQNPFLIHQAPGRKCSRLDPQYGHLNLLIVTSTPVDHQMISLEWAD